MQIHPTAVVHPSAELADDVEVQAYSIIEAGVAIGPGSVIGPHCVIGAGTRMGSGNRCFSGAQVGVLPQDLKHVAGRTGQTLIGDNNVFREFVTISSSTCYGGDEEDGKATRIGSNCLLMACSHVGHDCKLGNSVILANHVALAGHVTVQDKVGVGGLTGVHQFVVLGTLSYIGAMSRISKDTPPYLLIEGHSPVKCFGPNRVGLERSGFSDAAIHRVKEMYRLLCRSGLNTKHALEAIEQQVKESPEREYMLRFVRASRRGISK